MRMRRKKHLEERMVACGSNLIIAEFEDLNFETARQKTNYFDFCELFQNNNPIYLEIGCGKGQFVCELAKRNPDCNYVAVEKVGNVIVAAAEQALRENLTNIRFVKCGAEYLESLIPDHSVSGIYLNFSCPFPKKAYANHRLTSGRFLKIYKNILKDGAEIHQKTDNRGFFEFSIEEFTKAGFMLKNVSLDLHNSDFENNIVTEYENRFASQGLPIYRLEAVLRPNDSEVLS